MPRSERARSRWRDERWPGPVPAPRSALAIGAQQKLQKGGGSVVRNTHWSFSKREEHRFISAMAFTLAAVILLSPAHQTALKVVGVPLCSRIKAAGVLPFHFFIASILPFISACFSCLSRVC